MKKFVIITGSARANSNTKLMAKAFEAALYVKALSVGQKIDVKVIDATKLNIGPCHGCMGCFSTGKPCAFDDDFNRIADDITAADGIVFAAPVYWFSFPATVKALIDKMFCFYAALEDKFEGKKVALLSCCQDGNMSTFTGIKAVFDNGMSLMGAEIVGEVLVPAVDAAGDIKKTDGVDRAAQLATRFL